MKTTTTNITTSTGAKFDYITIEASPQATVLISRILDGDSVEDSMKGIQENFTFLTSQVKIESKEAGADGSVYSFSGEVRDFIQFHDIVDNSPEKAFVSEGQLYLTRPMTDEEMQAIFNPNL